MVNVWIGGHANNAADDPRNWSLGTVPDATQSGIFGTGIMVVHGNPLADAANFISAGTILPPTLVLNNAAFTAETLGGSVNIVVRGHDFLDLTRGINATAGGDIVTTGEVSAHLALSGVLNFGSYTQYGATLDTNGVTFVQANVLLDCAIRSTANNQVAAFSGSRMELDGPVDRHVMIIAAGTGQVVNPGDLGGPGGLIIDNSRQFRGFAALDDGFEELRDLSGITSYKLIDIPPIEFQGINTAVQLFSGNRLVKTAFLSEAGGVGPEPGRHNIQVASGFGQGVSQGTFIYDASDAQMAGFGLTKLPTHL